MSSDFLSGKKKWFFVLLYLSDLLAFAFSSFMAYKFNLINFSNALHVRILAFSFLILMILYTDYDLYKNKRNLFDDADMMKIIYSCIMTFLVMGAFIIMFYPYDLYLLTSLLFIFGFTIIFTNIGRYILNRIMFYARKNGYDVKNTVFFGNADKDLIEKLKDFHLGYNLVKVTNDMKELEKQLDNVDMVFVKTESISDRLLELMISHDRIQWKIIPSVFNLIVEPADFDEFRDYPIINVSKKELPKTYIFVKRAMDIILSGLTILLLSPLLIIAAILIKISMPGPIFFKQERLGKDLKPFMLYKFRTMVKDADKMKSKLEKKNEVKGLFKMKDDPRITKLGKVLRRTCIDELPQLINIFKGDMSIVGPRPHLERELGNFQGWRKTRFRIKPGLTGLWQVNGRHELNFDKAVLYDVYYVKRMSFLLDIQIILRTIPSIIMSRGKY